MSTTWAVVAFGSYSVHHLGIADANDFPFHIRLDTLSGNLLDIGKTATVCRLVRESVTECGTDGVGGEMLHMGGEVQQLVLITGVRMYSLHGKLSVGQCSRLVEDDSLCLGEQIHIVGSLDQDTVSGSPADTSEEGERNTDDQRTGARDNEEHQGTVQPSWERGERDEEWWDDGEGNGGEDDDGGVDAGKSGDESLTLRLILCGMLHQFENLRYGTLSETLCRAYLDNTREVDTTRDDFIVNADFLRHALSCQGGSIQGGRAFNDNTVKRYFLTRANHDDITNRNLVGIHVSHF